MPGLLFLSGGFIPGPTMYTPGRVEEVLSGGAEPRRTGEGAQDAHAKVAYRRDGMTGLFELSDFSINLQYDK